MKVSLDASDPDVALERHVAVDDRWEAICLAPCGVTIDRSTTLRIRGRGVVPSDEFSLSASRVTGDRARLHVDAGSRSDRAFGWLLFSGLVVGSLYLDFSWLVFSSSADGSNRGVNPLAFATVFALESAAIVGVAFFAQQHTTVTWKGQPMTEPSAPIGWGIALTSRGFVF